MVWTLPKEAVIYPLFAESAIYLLINLLINTFRVPESHYLSGSWDSFIPFLRIFNTLFAAIYTLFADNNTLGI